MSRHNIRLRAHRMSRFQAAGDRSCATKGLGGNLSASKIRGHGLGIVRLDIEDTFEGLGRHIVLQCISALSLRQQRNAVYFRGTKV